MPDSVLPQTEKVLAKGPSIHPALYIANWIFFSNLTILFNKWLLDTAGFKYPVILTCWHLVFATIATQLLARTTKLLDGRHNVKMSGRLYLRAIVPIGLCYSASLVFSNLVYLYLSVAFIQMLKAAAPVAVLFVSWAWGVANPSLRVLMNIMVIVAGVALASYGEVHFSWVGFAFQAAGIVFESIRLVMIQVLLSEDGQKMDPLVSLYYYAPVCAAMNIFVALFSEWGTFDYADIERTGLLVLLANAVVAFMLNIASVFLIGKTSGLVMTLTGILKNILLVIVSVMIWNTAISGMQILGYAFALGGLVYYSLGWEQMKAQAGAGFTWLRTVWGSPNLDESRLNPAVRRAIITGLLVLITMVVFSGLLFGGASDNLRDVSTHTS